MSIFDQKYKFGKILKVRRKVIISVHSNTKISANSRPKLRILDHKI